MGFPHSLSLSKRWKQLSFSELQEGKEPRKWVGTHLIGGDTQGQMSSQLWVFLALPEPQPPLPSPPHTCTHTDIPPGILEHTWGLSAPDVSPVVIRGSASINLGLLRSGPKATSRPSWVGRGTGLQGRSPPFGVIKTSKCGPEGRGRAAWHLNLPSAID